MQLSTELTMDKPTTVMELLKSGSVFRPYLMVQNRILIYLETQGDWWVYCHNPATVNVDTLYSGPDESAAIAALIGIDS